ncbi:MAG: prepilin-type N-terminal cleavage/methylation domain-containing protein [Desulfobacula sp.]|nr:prepilin-type N-terminal cleavage/methylation domain-containing protein [Desulfobacula sp.]
MNSLTGCCQTDNRGFTLLEILIAIVIFAIVIAMLFSTFQAFMISSREVKEDVLQIETITNLQKRITLDLESLFILQTPRYKKPGFDSKPDAFGLFGRQETIGQKVVASLTFSSVAHVKLGPDPRSGVARISYYVRENKNNGLDLCRADSLPPFPENIQSCTDPVLCRNISGFEVIYKDENFDEYKYWDSDSKEFKYTFPLSVNLKIISGSKEHTQVSVISIDIVQKREPIE